MFLQQSDVNVDTGQFYRFRNHCLLGLLQRDYQIWKHHLTALEVSTSTFNQVSQGMTLLALRDLLILRDLRDLRNFLNLQDFLPFERNLAQKYHDFIESPKFSSFLLEFQKIGQRFHELTPEQKRQYFINVDE